MWAPFSILFALFACAHAYSNEIFERLSYGAFLANSAYCVNTLILNDLFHKGDYFLKKQGLDIVHSFGDTKHHKAYSGTGFVALDKTTKQILVTFRGSATVTDWIVDFDFELVPYQPLATGNQCPQCSVHHGIYEQFKIFHDEVLKAVTDLHNQHPDFELIVAGHSLGGGYALIMGIEFQLLGFKPSVLTYGALRIGNKEMNQWINSIFKAEEALSRINNGENYYNTFLRVVQTKDLVPLLPPGGSYGHAGILFTIKDASTFNPPMKNVRLDGLSPQPFDVRSVADILKAIVKAPGEHLSYLRRMAGLCVRESVMIN
ncbi:HBL224Wp [Eremothecium sinecaudum]|uniref:triacylglycerol lipase n=1 Tax=Eremothecium sinecaudum TaxID=45286 RepID=A0A109UW53_9SACH|nr:HBL224Wp [Eremothecium sinecaudum]AMD18678.1 HBL224Wp [Eremothecium sinecaudum]